MLVLQLHSQLLVKSCTSLVKQEVLSACTYMDGYTQLCTVGSQLYLLQLAKQNKLFTNAFVSLPSWQSSPSTAADITTNGIGAPAVGNHIHYPYTPANITSYSLQKLTSWPSAFCRGDLYYIATLKCYSNHLPQPTIIKKRSR